MGLSVKYLPRATPLDPAEDPPSSIDPLGTMGTAERIAEILFPGITARMWRPRLLTFTAVAAIIAKRVMVSRGDSEDSGLNARLALERLFVSSVIRQQVRDPDAWGNAARRLPGSLLARRALHSGDTPLGRSNFLKGQAIFGPFGVMARLARNLGIVDEDDALGRNGEELLMAWSADEQLKGILDEDDSGSSGRQWINRVSQATADHLFEEQWRSSQWSGWQELAEPLRLDNIGGQECRVLKRLLGSDPIRGRCIELLCMPDVKALYRAAKEEGRGEQDRRVLVEAFLPELMAKEHYEDGIIELAVQLADAYEEGASYLETAFNCLRWALTKRGGQAKPSEIEADKQLQPVFYSICRQIKKTSLQLRGLTEKVPPFRRSRTAALWSLWM